MTYVEAVEYAKTISKEYGRTTVFRERSAKESYQAMISSLPLGSTVVAEFDGGKLVSSL